MKKQSILGQLTIGVIVGVIASVIVEVAGHFVVAAYLGVIT